VLTRADHESRSCDQGSRPGLSRRLLQEQLQLRHPRAHLSLPGKCPPPPPPPGARADARLLQPFVDGANRVSDTQCAEFESGEGLATDPEFARLFEVALECPFSLAV